MLQPWIPWIRLWYSLFAKLIHWCGDDRDEDMDNNVGPNDDRDGGEEDDEVMTVLII